MLRHVPVPTGRHTRHAALRRFVKRANSRGMQSLAAVVSHRKLTGAANLFGERAPASRRRCRQWPETHAAPPQRQPHERKRQKDNGTSVEPDERQKRRVFFLGQEMDIVATAQLSRRDEEPPVVAVEDATIAERGRVDDRDTATADCHAHRLCATS